MIAYVLINTKLEVLNEVLGLVKKIDNVKWMLLSLLSLRYFLSSFLGMMFTLPSLRHSLSSLQRMM